jgi:uncharacterized protein (UPF0303 family)
MEKRKSMGVAEDLDRVSLQERELQFAAFDEQTAWRLGSRLRALAEERSLSIVVDVRRFGQPLFYTALQGTTPDNVEWVKRKSNVVARFHRSSYGVGLTMKSKNDSLEARGLPISDYASHGGSFPLTVQGAGIIGSVTVSGLPQRADHELVVEVLCELLGKNYASLKLGPE